MKTEKNINPQSTTRKDDSKQDKPVTTGTSHLNQETKTPQKGEKETWKNPDPTAPEKRQEVYAGKKDQTINNQEDFEGEGSTDEDIDQRPEAKLTNNRGKENNDIEKEHNQNDQINP
jgi:hypothetical protein